MSTASKLAAFFAVSLVASIPAAAQSALGGGDALDRGLGVGSGGRNPSPAAISTNRDRNLLVTRDVVGGRGFRGSVGYTAPEDFRGHLGSNDSFDFRASSAIANPQLIQMGSTFEQLRFGQQIGLIEYRRSGSGAPEAIDAQTPMSISTGPMGRMLVDRSAVVTSLGLDPGNLIEPRVVGSTTDRDGRVLVYNASSMRGVTLEPANQNLGAIGLSTFDGVRIRQDVESGGVPPSALGSPFETKFNLDVPVDEYAPKPMQQPQMPPEPGMRAPADLDKPADTAESSSALNSRLATDPTTTRIDPSTRTDYEKILGQIVDRYGNASNTNVTVEPELLNQLTEDYKQLRQQLVRSNLQPTLKPDGKRGPKPDATTEEPPKLGTRLTEDPRSTDQKLAVDERARGESEKISPFAPKADQDAEKSRMGLPDPEGMKSEPDFPIAIGEPEFKDFGLVLRHGQRIERLAGPENSRFNELISTAEQKLQEGDYFTAERRFDRALRFTPGHPLATAGLAHSQLGAGLYLSSSLTLRNLLTLQPEMIDARYAPDLLPRPERLDAAIATIRQRLQSEKDLAAYGLLLAYIGHQLDDRAMAQEGLEAMSQADPGAALAPLLRSIWLAPPTIPTQPSPAPSMDAPRK